MDLRGTRAERDGEGEVGAKSNCLPFVRKSKIQAQVGGREAQVKQFVMQYARDDRVKG